MFATVSYIYSAAPYTSKTRFSSWLLLLLGGLLGSLLVWAPPAHGQVENLFDSGSQESPDLPNPTELENDWQLYLTDTESEQRPAAAQQLVAHLTALAGAIPEDARPPKLDSDLNSLQTALDKWLTLQQQVQSPVEAPVAQDLDTTLAAYLQLGEKRDLTAQQIKIVEQSLESLERDQRDLSLTLDNLRRDYRALEVTSPARFKLGLQRMIGRLLIMNAELNSEQKRFELTRLLKQLSTRDAALTELARQLEPQADLGVELPECDPDITIEQPLSLLDEVTQIENTGCQVMYDLLNSWQLMAEAELVPMPAIDNIELRRIQLTDSMNRLPDLRERLQTQLLAEASNTNAEQGASLEDLSSGLEQLAVAEQQLNQSNLMLQLIDLQQIRGSSTLVRFWYGVKTFMSDAWRNVNAALRIRLFSIGDSIVTTLSILRVIFIVWLGWWLSRLFRSTIGRFSRHRFAGGESAAWYTLSRIGHYIIIIAAIFIGLSSIGLDLSNLAIIAGALSVGVGFGLQSIVSNFVSGLILLFERSIKIGDYIDLEGGITGQVRAINTRFTRINTNDNIDILVPNSELVSNRLINWTMHEAMRRLHVPFGVAYGSDKELVKKAALEAAEKVPYTVMDYPNRNPDVWLVEFGDSSINFELLIWLRDGVKRPARVQAAYLWELETALAKYGIEIPFPQRDLHLRSGFPERDSKGPPSKIE